MIRFSISTVFFGVTVALTQTACKPSKTEALDYYEQIYKNSTDTRLGGKELRIEMKKYFDEYVSSNSGLSDSSKLAILYEKNKKAIEDIKSAKETNDLLPDFDYQVDGVTLKSYVGRIIILQLLWHQKDAVAILDSYRDGQLTKEEIEILNKAQKNLEDIKTDYKDWKAVRKKFCNEFGITYDDIRALKDEYDPTDDEK